MKVGNLSWKEKSSIVLLCITAVLLMGFQLKFYGWIVFAIGLMVLSFCERKFAKNILLVYGSMAILGLIPITADISYGNFFLMGTALIAAIAIPYIISHKIYKQETIKFRFHHGRYWKKREIAYILITAVLSYFLLPFYLRNSGAYLNWPAVEGVSEITRLFIGTNGLGIWDELFFVSTVLGLFRAFMPFGWANVAQSIMFTSFLFELGFTGWGPLMIFPFALLQGYIFKKTDSLFYVITIHLTLDLVLFFALIHAHHPAWIPFFVT